MRRGLGEGLGVVDLGGGVFLRGWGSAVRVFGLVGVSLGEEGYGTPEGSG